MNQMKWNLLFIDRWSFRLKVHTHCKSRVGDSCGLTAEHLRAVFDDLIQQNNQVTLIVHLYSLILKCVRMTVGDHFIPLPCIHFCVLQNWWHPHSALPPSRSFGSSETTAFQYPDPAAIGDSSSSTNSSAPSTPALLSK